MALLSEILPHLGVFTPKYLLTLYAPILFLIYYLLWVVYARTFHPLAKIPGPFWPSISQTWLMWRHQKGDIEYHQRALHKRYGPIIRIGPDQVAVADPIAIPLIYPTQNPLKKTDWYRPWRPQGLDSQLDLFTQTDEKAHAAYRRIVGGVYSLRSILKSEKELDQTLGIFLERLGRFADSGKEFDFGLWLEM